MRSAHGHFDLAHPDRQRQRGEAAPEQGRERRGRQGRSQAQGHREAARQAARDGGRDLAAMGEARGHHPALGPGKQVRKKSKVGSRVTHLCLHSDLLTRARRSPISACARSRPSVRERGSRALQRVFAAYCEVPTRALASPSAFESEGAEGSVNDDDVDSDDEMASEVAKDDAEAEGDPVEEAKTAKQKAMLRKQLSDFSKQYLGLCKVKK